MKKIIAFILVCVTCCTLLACENLQLPGTQPDYANAAALDMDAYTALKESDPAAAKKAYNGKTYRYTGTVVVIEADYCILGYTEFNALYDTYTTYYQLKVYLEDGAPDQLQLDTEYTFSGVLDTSEDVLIMKRAILAEDSVTGE